MKAKKEAKSTSESGEIVKFDEAGMPQLDVWLEDETVWLTQAQMAELFGCAIANVNMHLNHIYADEELAASATIKDFLMVRFEGKRRVTRSVKHYNHHLHIDACPARKPRADRVSRIVAPSPAPAKRRGRGRFRRGGSLWSRWRCGNDNIKFTF